MTDIVGETEVTEIFVDGVGSIDTHEDVVRIVFFALRAGEKYAAVRLAIPAAGLPDVIQAMVISLTNAVKTIIKPRLS